MRKATFYCWAMKKENIALSYVGPGFGEEAWTHSDEGLKVSGSQGLKVSRSQGLKVSRSQGLKVSRSKGLKVSRSQGLRVPGS